VTSKKLLICSPSHAVYGGVETIVNDLCWELPKRGWDTVLALGRGSRFNDVDSYRAAYPGLPIVEIDGLRGTEQSRLEALKRLIRRERPNIVFSARIFDAYAAVGSLKEHVDAPRLAVAVRGYESPYLYDLRMYRDIIDLCVVDGNLLAAAATRWSGLAEERVVSIPGGIRPPSVPVVPRIAGNVLRIGYVGRLAQSDKRVLDLIPFIAKLEESRVSYHLSIVGTGPEEDDLREKLQDYVSAGKVRFTGWQGHDELYREVYPNLDCLIHLSAAEGVTIAPREAMVHGVVPVISRFIGLKSEGQFRNEVNSMTFDVGDMDRAVAAVRKLANEPGLLERLSKCAMTSQVGKYTFDGSMNAWAEAFEQCVEQPRLSGPLPRVSFPAEGRLNRFGLSPWLAQRVRDLAGRKQVHGDPGSEWPTASGLMPSDAAADIFRFAAEYETGIHG